MSRAFVSEDAAAAEAALPPERPVPPGPNPVTPAGLAAIRAEIARLGAALSALPAQDPARATLARDLRYWRAREANAELVPPLAVSPGRVVFGAQVTLARDNGSTQVWRIVGEDEAAPARGLISWRAPLAEALLGAEPGDEIDPGPGRPRLCLLRLDP